MSNNYYYPKNWQSNGLGWVNLTAMGYPQSPGYPQAPPLPSGAQISGQSLSYPQSNQSGNKNPPYPTSPFEIMPQPMGAHSAPPYPTTPYPSFPQPMDNRSSNSSGVSSLYPTIPSLPDTDQSSYGFSPKKHSLYPRLDSKDESEITAASDSEDSAVDTQEIPFSAIHVPEVELIAWLGEKASGIRSRGEVQDFISIRNQCLANGALFEDPDFPANDSSLMFSRRPDRHLEWLRPMEFCDNPQFFVEGYSRHDVRQGELGDCWLLAATANLTQDQNLFFRVVPYDQSFDEEYAGVFHFRFWQYGKWIDVVVDDRLPTYHGELVYMHSSEKNEFWSALLEKAYAKLHGSYEALKGGSTCEAMEDFTGGVGEMYELNQAPPNLFSILHKAYERNSLMACSLEPDPNVLEAETPEGLIRGHAYSITKVQMMDISTPNRSGMIQMIRLRNPWGNEAEWNGPWSDQSPEWRFIPEHVKLDIGLTFDMDGEFWMSYTDFVKHFDRVEICNLSPDSLTEEQQRGSKKKWEMSVFEGEWTPGVTAGGCRNFLETFWHNPQYVITLEDPDEDDNDGKCTAIVALMQKNRRSKRNMGMDCLTIGFAVYHLTEHDLMTRPQRLEFFKYHASVARSPHFINLREVSARFKLPPGHYLIVPSTFDPNEEGEFLIRVFSEAKNNMEENDEEIGMGNMDDRANELDGTSGEGERPSVIPSLPDPVRPDPQRSALEKLFMEIAGEDMEVDWIELKRILDHSMRDDLPKGPENGYQANVGYVSAGRGAGGNGDDGGGGTNWLALLCGSFCKDTPLAESFGLNEPQNVSTSGNPTMAPVPAVSNDGFSKDVCRSMVAMMDVDQSGKLGFEEFRALLTDVARWKAVFKLYDPGNTGRMSSFQLRDALHSAGYQLNNRILNALAHRYGSRDGMINFDDFIMCAVKIKTMIDLFRERDVDGTNMATFSMDEWVEKTIYS